jgi:hypothetical protein
VPTRLAAVTARVSNHSPAGLFVEMKRVLLLAQALSVGERLIFLDNDQYPD